MELKQNQSRCTMKNMEVSVSGISIALNFGLALVEVL